MGYEEQYKQYVSDIETALQTAFPLKKITERCIYESARYSLLAGGKRAGEDTPAQHPQPAAARQRHRRRNAQRA